MINLIKSVLIIMAITSTVSCSCKEEKVLVFSKTLGMRHKSIEPGIKAIKNMGAENGFTVETTEDSTYFKEENLKQFSSIIFLNTTLNVLNDVQQAEFEHYIQSGGGFVGVHSATDTEYDWPWYNKLVGAYFNGHPRIQDALLEIVDKEHPSTSFLDDTWEKNDEWYNFKDIYSEINVLIEIDENSYEGGIHGEHHPISWYHEYDGGRAFYTEMGHTSATFENEIFLKHLLGGIQYAMGK